MPIPLPVDEELPDFFRYEIDKEKTEILSCRIEYDNQLPTTKSISIPFGFFQFNSQLDRLAVDWYSKHIKSEMEENENGKSFYMLPHCHIMTGDIDVFHFNGKIYERIDIIFGKDAIFWRFTYSLNDVNDDRKHDYEQQLTGQCILDIGYCPCCIGKQFKQLIHKLREYIDYEVVEIYNRKYERL